MRSDFAGLPLHSQLVYRYAEMVYSVVQGKDEDEDLGTVSEMIGNVEKAVRPHKDTLLHDLIRDVGGAMNEYAISDATEYFVDDAREMLSAARMPIPRWLTYDHISRGEPDRRNALRTRIHQAFEAVVPSIFYILFSDRTFLRDFQQRVAENVRDLKRFASPAALARDGVLKRQAIPSWLKAGIFYRDRGQCQNCMKNLSGLGRPVTTLHLDHIVPLAQSGSNDPTNFQLLCDRCNLSKGGRNVRDIPTFTPYW